MAKTLQIHLDRDEISDINRLYRDGLHALKYEYLSPYYDQMFELFINRSIWYILYFMTVDSNVHYFTDVSEYVYDMAIDIHNDWSNDFDGECPMDENEIIDEILGALPSFKSILMSVERLHGYMDRKMFKRYFSSNVEISLSRGIISAVIEESRNGTKASLRSA